MEVRKTVETYIEQLTNEDNINPALNLFESGLLTSLDVLDLIRFVEETFEFQISEEDVSIESFGTINGIIALIEKNKKNL